MKKKFMALLLTLAMVATFMPAMALTAFAYYNEVNVTLENTEVVYTGAEQKPVIVKVTRENSSGEDEEVKLEGTQGYNQDYYTVDFGSGDYVDAGTYNMVVTVHHYTSYPYYHWVEIDKTVSFKIKKAPLTVEWITTEFVYNGKVQTPVAVLKNEINDYQAKETVVVGGQKNAGDYEWSLETAGAAVDLDDSDYDKDNYYFPSWDWQDLFTDFTIAKSPLTVKANDVKQVYKEGEVGLTWQVIEGEVFEGDEITGIWASCEKEDELGSYDIVLTQEEEENPNYDILLQDGTYSVVPHDYVFLNGVNQKVIKNVQSTMSFRTNGRIDLFKGAKVDGKDLVLGKDYTVKAGSTIVELDPIYVGVLAEGNHVLTTEYEDGSVSTAFTVANQVATGDAENMGLWMMLAIAAMVAAGYAVSRKEN